MSRSLNSQEDVASCCEKVHVVGPGNVKLLSQNEIDKITDNGNVKVMCFTWNIAEKNVHAIKALCHLFKQIPLTERPHIIAISLQELPPSDVTFHTKVISALEKCLDETHCTMCWVRRWSQIQIVMVAKKIKNNVSTFSYRFLPCKMLAKPVRTKGSIVIYMKIFKMTCAFISCHFSHQGLKNRVANSIKIYANFVTTQELNTAIDSYFWFGDMNFRLNLDWDNELVKKLEKHDTLTNRKKLDLIKDILLSSDELTFQMNKNIIFKGFKEPSIHFLPTYKYIKDTDSYDKGRNLAYTDRVIYYSKKENLVRPYRYDSVLQCMVSDHRPVYAIFIVDVSSTKFGN
uniref:IPPc domain-containing protein n=1 Tax=Rhabditophanes sp. KR3021 TaxID=114890 RepID=A0AC35TKY1_9BILA